MICEIENLSGRIVSFPFNSGKTIYVPTRGAIRVNSDEIRKNEFFLKLVKKGKLSVKDLDKAAPTRTAKRVEKVAETNKVAAKK